MWVWIPTLCIVAGIALIAGFVFLIRAWRVEETPVSLIRSAAQGYAKLKGHADLMPGPPIISPLTSSRCVWWSYKIEDRSRSARNQGGNVIESGTSNDLFLIRDATGECVIDPEHTEVFVADKKVWYGEEPHPLRSPPLGGFSLTSRYRYVEETIVPQERMFALGFFRTQNANLGAMAINDEIAQVLHTWKQDQAGLLRRFDADHDGQLSDQEWEGARQAAREQVLAQEQDAMQRQPTNVLAKSKDGRRFIISTRPEKQVVKRLQLWAAACLLLFVVTGAAAGYLITEYYNMSAEHAASTTQP